MTNAKILTSAILLMTAMCAQAGPITFTDTSGNGSAVGNSATMDTGTGSVVAATLETELFLAPGTLALLATDTPTEGSGVSARLFAVTAGDVINFEWNFLTNENTPAGEDINDFSFYSIGIAGVLADTFSSGFVDSSSIYDEETGWNYFSFVAPVSGFATLSLGVVNVGDFAVDSALWIRTAQVPEPGTLLLLGAGLFGLGFAKRKRNA